MSKHTPPKRLSEPAQEAWREVVDAHPNARQIIGPELEAYANTIARARDAAHRVDTEGSVIADERGAPIPHPALEIERNAQRDIRGWADKFAPKDDGPLGF